ncbi:MAG: 2-nitropropane dioxygenase [Chloroflexi bacterium 44-23]|mgnify:CR=1 FL=1|nr:MAG: 2-nitropropane dioxygenase [Chloroflexi bacterium 44-23]
MTLTSINESQSSLTFHGTGTFSSHPWIGNVAELTSDSSAVGALLRSLDLPLWAVRQKDRVALTSSNGFQGNGLVYERLAYAPAIPLSQLGDPAFQETYGTRYAYYSGAMANAIASVEMVVALGKAGMLGSYGSAGVSPARIEDAIQRIQKALPNGPYMVNLIHSPNETNLERILVELFLRYKIPVIEASAYMDMTYGLAHFRVAGLSKATDGSVQINNRIIAKISRKEVARKFMLPVSEEFLRQLLEDGKISPEQAELAHLVPVADDITVEADSGGHTDNRPLVGLIPTMLRIRDQIQTEMNYQTPIRVGAGGGIGTPEAALAAFMMGAAYIVTGSVNQACVEAGASTYTRQLLAQADMADVTMAPAADMFEMGVRVQVLKRGSMFAMRASRLYELYNRYSSIEEIPEKDREKIEKTIFKRDLNEIWEETQQFFRERDIQNLERALADPHHKMALIFRWYLGLSSRWSVVGEPSREMDYQIWCGPSMGTFNEWVRGTYLETKENRYVVDVVMQLLTGAAYLARVRSLSLQGVQFPPEISRYMPQRQD